MKIRMSGAIAAAALLLPMLAGAQTLYRCGSTYSQTPCGEDSKNVKVLGAASPDQAGRDPSNVCASRVIKHARRNGGRARITGTETAGTEPIQYAGQTVAAKVYRVMVSTADKDGDDRGTEVVTCHLSEDGQRVLRVGDD